MNVTTQQLAELLIGIARSQQAVIDAIDAQKPGFKATYLTPALDSVAKIRSTNRAPSLQEFPARVLSQCQSRGGPNLEQVMKDLEALLSGCGAGCRRPGYAKSGGRSRCTCRACAGLASARSRFAGCRQR